MSFRVVVTGSRGWPHPEEVSAQLDALWEERGSELTVIQGGASGADEAARGWVARHTVDGETYEANWDLHGPKAGPIRNRAMLQAGADLVLAFPAGGPKESPGTWDTIIEAIANGIEVRLIPPPKASS